MAELWRYTTGNKGLNRITVYERIPDGPLQIEWFDRDGRHRETLKNMAGVVILDRDIATEIADSASTAQRKRREAGAAYELLGRPDPRTLKELTDAYHNAKEAGWSHHHVRIQKGLRDFWLLSLGGNTQLREITPARVNQVVRIKAKGKDWSPRSQQKYLRYIVDAFTYAERKLKWIGEANNLSAVDLPRPRGVSRAYSLEDIQAMIATAPQVDPRIAAALWVLWVTGRRLNAVRTLTVAALEHEGERLVIQFPGETDKARRSGRAYLGERAACVVRALLELPAVQASGLLFPATIEGKPKRALSDGEFRELLRTVEQRAGVELRRGRGFHAIKRRFSSESKDKAAASKQSGTRRETLETHYDQDDPAPKIALADDLDRLAVGA